MSWTKFTNRNYHNYAIFVHDFILRSKIEVNYKIFASVRFDGNGVTEAPCCIYKHYAADNASGNVDYIDNRGNCE